MSEAAQFGYWAAAVAFAILALLPLALWRDRVLTRWMALLALAGLVWAVAHASVETGAWPLMGEVVRFGAWLAVLLGLLAQPHFINAPSARPALRVAAIALSLFVALMLIASMSSVIPGAEALSLLHHPLPFLIFAVSGAVLVEQLYRNTHSDRRWAIKPLCIALASVFVYDIYLFANATLFAAVSGPLWEARGYINAVIVPFLLLATARSLEVRRPVAVSRQLLFHSMVLVGTGVYLLLMAAAGYYLRIVGGTWGGVFQAVFLFGAVMLLAVTLVSGSVRARLKVLLSKHLLRHRYDYRREWLRFIETLSSSDVDQSLRQRAIVALAEMMEAPRGLLFSRDEVGAYHLTASWNFGEPPLLRELADGPLARFLTDTGWVVDLHGYRSHPSHYNGLEVPDWLWAMDRAWLVVPLQQLDRLQGFIVLGEPRAPRQLDWEDHDLLKTIGRQLASYVALLDATDALMDSRQFDAYNRLSAYVVHDLKNVSGQLGLIVNNAERHMDNPEFVQDAFDTVSNAKARMDKILSQLRKGRGGSSADGECFSLSAVLHDLIQRRQVETPVPTLVGAQPEVDLRGSLERFLNALEHLVQNAQEATRDDGAIQLEPAVANAFLYLAIRDNGTGMDAEFLRDRLFRPFQTTKGNAGMGIGVFEAREIIRSMGGELEVRSEKGVGTEFTVRVPCWPARSENAENPNGEPAAAVVSEEQGENVGRVASQIACRRG